MALNLTNAVPLRWPSGPLELARRATSGNPDARTRQTLARWHDPAALEFLKDTPIDCLVVSWSAGLPADEPQWRTAAPLVQAAHRRSLSVIGWIEGPGEHRAALAAAKRAGLDAVAMQGGSSPDLPVIPWSERDAVSWDSPAPAVAIAGNVWPRVNPSQHGADANAGPTSLPWLDSNSWFIQMARARLQAPLWIVFDPPGNGAAPSAQAYANAVTDSEVAGGRWLISLDDDLRAGLAEGAAPALASWTQTAATARFFAQHAGWKSYRSLGLVGVISDFTGPNLEMSGEILNLMARRDLIFRVIWKSQAQPQAFRGLKALLYTDRQPPGPDLRRELTGFVQQGGLLVTGPEWGAAGKPAPADLDTQFDVRALGKGRLAVARQELSDPYQVAVDTQFLLSHRYDLFKIYNAPSSGCTRYTAPPAGAGALLQFLSYADARFSFGLRTVWLRDSYAAARLWTIGQQPAELPSEPAEEYTGVEYHLPAHAPQSYLALEFEKPERGTKA